MFIPDVFLEICTGKGYSIYIGGFPYNATPEQVEQEFKKFGSIRSNGVQVRSNKVCGVMYKCSRLM